MLEIKIDDNYQITADKYNYVLQEIKKPKKADTEEETYLSSVGYYNTITKALHGYKELQIRNSACTTIGELIELINKLDEKIDLLVKGN